MTWRDRADGRAMRILFPLLFTLVGVGLLTGAYVAAADTMELREVAIEVPGQVVGATESRDEDGTTYAPIYEYEVDGRTLRHEGSVSSSNRPDIGSTETLFVNPDDPTDAKADTFLDQWFLPTLLGGMGAVFFLVGVGVGLAGLAGGRRTSDPTSPTTLGIPVRTSTSPGLPTSMDVTRGMSAGTSTLTADSTQARHDDEDTPGGAATPPPALGHAPNHAGHDPFVGDDDPTNARGPFV